MDDTKFGTHNKRGDYRPDKRFEYPPVFVWPAQPLKFLKWVFAFPGFLWPWNTVFLFITLIMWMYFTPPMEEMAELSVGWISYILVRNAILTLVYFGTFHLRLYVQKAQKTRFKFNARWPDKNIRHSCSTIKPWTTCSGPLSARYRFGRHLRSECYGLLQTTIWH